MCNVEKKDFTKAKLHLQKMSKPYVNYQGLEATVCKAFLNSP